MTDRPLQIHGFTGCPSCAALKDWLHAHRIPYAWVEHPDPAERQRWYTANDIASRTMPQAFLEGELLERHMLGDDNPDRGYDPASLRALADDAATFG